MLKSHRARWLVAFGLVAAVVAWRVRVWLWIARQPADPSAGEATSLADFNRDFYDALWSRARLIPPHRFNTWPIVHRLVAYAPRALEIGPGLRPRLPLETSDFVDLSPSAVEKLWRAGARVVAGEVSALPCDDDAYDLVCALDVVEHVTDDLAALREISRVTHPGGRLLLAVPLHPGRWNAFDDAVGHGRRYEPAALVARLAECGFTIESSAVYGMQPRSSRLLDFGMRCLQRRRERAMWFYSHIFMPLGLLFQPALRLRDGFENASQSDEILLVCRKIL